MKKKMLSLFLAFAMVITMAAPALAAEESEGGKIVILHTNDVHCGIDQAKNEEGEVTNIGYAGVAAYKTAMETEYGAGNVTLVDAGDAIQGGPIGTLSKGAYIVDIMNEVGYDLAIPGNHEFDYGMENFLSLAKEKPEYEYLCANFTDLEGNPVLEGYKVLTYGDVKVGYVGIDTPESFTKSTPTYFQDAEGNYIYSFCQGNEGADLYDAVQKAVREKYPVTLTADAALLLARMKDAELAPLETVAEDVGVDPTVYYTTRTLGQAFLDKCDRARMAGFAPLFAGSADAGRAALAALLPNTFLQALVWQALTAPELPEVTEHEDL